nr:hypothetical protein [uncultured Steroidobacter sp.]
MRICVLLACLVLAGAACAQTNDPFDHRFSISAAAYWPGVDTTARANGPWAGVLVGFGSRK